MKLASTISLPKSVKRLADGGSFKDRAERNYFIQRMVELEYQASRMARQRSRGADHDSKD